MSSHFHKLQQNQDKLVTWNIVSVSVCECSHVVGSYLLMHFKACELVVIQEKEKHLLMSKMFQDELRIEPSNSETNVYAKHFLALLRVLHKPFMSEKCFCNFSFGAWRMLQHHFKTFISKQFSGTITDVFFFGAGRRSHSFPMSASSRWSRDSNSSLFEPWFCLLSYQAPAATTWSSLKYLYKMYMKSSACTVGIWRSSPM